MAAAATMAAQAAVPVENAGFKPVKFDGEPVGAYQEPGSRAEGYTISYCGDLYTYYTLGYSQYDQFIAVPPEMATQLAGATLDQVTFSAVIQSKKSLPGSIFVMEFDEADELVKVVTTDCEVVNSNGKPTPSQTVNFTEPYVIKEGVGFFFGFSVTGAKYVQGAQNNDYPIGIDEEGSANPMAGYVAVYNNGALQGIASAAQQFNANLFISGHVSGDNLSLTDMGMLDNISFGDFTLAVLKGGSDREAQASIFNIGDNPITSIEYTYAYNGGEPMTGTAEVNIGSKKMASVALPVKNFPLGRTDMALVINKVNGVEKAVTEGECSAIRLAGDGYKRKLVVEEATSTNCGFCPSGIVGMDYMAETYPDDFLGIAVHSNFNGADPMQISDYLPWINTYVSSFPSCMVNRDPIWVGLSPSKNDLKSYYNVWKSQAAPVKIDFSQFAVSADKTEIEVGTRVEFDMQEANANYKMMYVVVENKVPGVQLNYYAGGGYGAMGGWEKKGQRVAWDYNDVPRAVNSLWGIEGSIPADIAKGKGYYNTATLSLNKVKNVENIRVIALVLDGKTGVVLNGEQFRYGETLGIADTPFGKSDVKVAAANGSIVITGEYANATVCNLAGAVMGRTDNLAPGIYIVNVDGKAFKVAVK